MEASPDLQPISLRFQEMSTNNKLGFQTPTQLPNDIINGIIERLPAISNFRFKCVSKQWFSLNVEALELKSQTHTVSGIFYVTCNGENDIGAKYVKTEKDQNDDSCIDGTLSFLPKHRYMRIHDSCNGLLLCECWDTPYLHCTDKTFDETACLYVCNPATRKWVVIPCIFVETNRLAILDFNPLVSLHFNVIIIMCDLHASPDFKVYSSKTREWSVSRLMGPLLSQCRNYSPILFYNGLIYAINYLENKDIIGFDVNGKLHTRIGLPGKPCPNDKFFIYHLAHFGGCLHYFCIGSNSKMYVWKLESGSWLLKSCFSVPFPMHVIEDIKFHPIKIDVVFLEVDDRLYSYNIKSALIVELCSSMFANYCLYSPFYSDFCAMG